MEEAQRRDQRWIQQVQNWRNERREEEVGARQIEENEEREGIQRTEQDRVFSRRQIRLENITNNISGQNLQEYQAQMIVDHPPIYFRSPSPSPSLPPSRSPSPPQPQPALNPGPHPRIQHQLNLPIGRAEYHEPAARHSLGPMNVQCPKCHALHFNTEKLSKSLVRQPQFGICCLSGQVNLPAFPDAPRELAELFDGTSPYSSEFKTHIRQYNTAFAFTSLGVNVDQSVIAGSGPYSFRISGELHHLSGSLIALPQNASVYAQIYIHDPAQQLQQ